jgi:hypothetical protein
VKSIQFLISWSWTGGRPRATMLRAGRGRRRDPPATYTRRPATSRPPGEPSRRCDQGDAAATRPSIPRAVPQSSRRWHGLPNPPIGDHDAGGGPFSTRRLRTGFPTRRLGPAGPGPAGRPGMIRTPERRRRGRRHRRPRRAGRPRLRRRDRLSETAYRLGCPTSRLGRRSRRARSDPRRKAARVTVEGRRYMDIHSGSRDRRDRPRGPYHSGWPIPQRGGKGDDSPQLSCMRIITPRYKVNVLTHRWRPPMNRNRTPDEPRMAEGGLLVDLGRRSHGLRP